MDNIKIFTNSEHREGKSDLEKQIVDNYRLTTAEILYHLPDHPAIIQTYIWQDYDLEPKFPELKGFLRFWRRELDGKLHSVYVASKKLISGDEIKYFSEEFTTH